MLYYILRDRFYNACVGADQVIAGHARLAGKTGSDHYHIRPGRFGVVVGRANRTAIIYIDRSLLPNIERFAFGQPFFDIDQYNFIGDFALGQHVGTGGAYVSGTYNGDFHIVRDSLGWMQFRSLNKRDAIY